MNYVSNSSNNNDQNSKQLLHKCMSDNAWNVGFYENGMDKHFAVAY